MDLLEIGGDDAPPPAAAVDLHAELLAGRQHTAWLVLARIFVFWTPAESSPWQPVF